MDAGGTMRIQGVPVAGILPSFAAYIGILPRRVIANYKDFFSYGVDFLPLAASAAGTPGTINVDGNSDFLCVAGVASVTNAADNTTVPAGCPVMVTIAAAGAGNVLMNTARPLVNLFGTGQQPAYWPYPKFFKRSSTITVTLANNIATNFNVRIDLVGFRVYDFPADPSDPNEQY